MIDFTTTATCRPEVLRQTLTSFSENLLGVDMSKSFLHLNIDPVPDKGDWTTTYEVASSFFAKVHINVPKVASFPAAVKWCWSQPRTRFFFHLEDDWIMKRPIVIDEMIAILLAQADLSCVNLRAYNFPDGDSRICLSPCLMRTEHARVISERLSITANPEKQLRPVAFDNPEGGKHGGFLGMQVPLDVVLKDIGRTWLATSGWKKTKVTHFTTWEKV